MLPKKKEFRRGFTLVEVLIVVVIAVTVTVFAVPSFKKSQARTQYMAASGVLMELATATQILTEEYPALEITSAAFSSNPTTAPTIPTISDAVAWMQSNQYLGKVDFQSGKYKGYAFAFSTKGAANCGTSCKKANAVACMANTNHMTQAYRCAWVSSLDGMLHNLETE